MDDYDICSGCKREFSTDIREHLGYCTYCTRNDSEGGTKDFYERRLNTNESK